MADADHRLDTCGLLCPEPLMLVRNRIREMRSGEVLYVVATDPSTERDFTDFCRFMGHRLLSHELHGDQHHYRLRKG
jgi:tRNA 2-thiouridine synthesizing protein A